MIPIKKIIIILFFNTVLLGQNKFTQICVESYLDDTDPHYALYERYMRIKTDPDGKHKNFHTQYWIVEAKNNERIIATFSIDQFFDGISGTFIPYVHGERRMDLAFSYELPFNKFKGLNYVEYIEGSKNIKSKARFQNSSKTYLLIDEISLMGVFKYKLLNQ